MNTQAISSGRGQELLARMGQIPVIVQGKVSERRSGAKVTGCKLQRWRRGHNETRHVPAALVDRPKTGFSIPLDDWLRGPLKSWASDLLSADRLQRQGLFNAKRVELKLGEHMSGRRNHGYWLWNVLMAQAWHDEWCAD